MNCIENPQVNVLTIIFTINCFLRHGNTNTSEQILCAMSFNLSCQGQKTDVHSYLIKIDSRDIFHASPSDPPRPNQRKIRDLENEDTLRKETPLKIKTFLRMHLFIFDLENRVSQY